MVSRVEQLFRDVQHARQFRQEQCRSLLDHVAQRLDVISAHKRRRDRQRAPGFNVFKYLREDEAGLSNMIADLLDPAAKHSQGTAFLEAMLETLPETSGRFGELQPTPASPIKVVTERQITSGRRIDITVDVPFSDQRFCLAFENKPYAQDQSGQVSAYLEYLREEYGTHFLLVYLPPVHREPDEASLPQPEREGWRGHFRVMPYLGKKISLRNWFAACRNRCEADGVRWFLKSAESFCKDRFGESTMATDPGTQYARDYLSEHPKYLSAALAVHDAWPLLRAEVCKRFLEHLRNIVKQRLRKEVKNIDPDFYVRCHYGGEKQGSSSRLWIGRNGWVRYDDLPNNEDGRSAVSLESLKKGPYDWWWGVRSPKTLDEMNARERKRRTKLKVSLRDQEPLFANANPKTDHTWLQWAFVRRRYRDWYPLVPKLYEECEAGGGPITNYYADNLLRIAAIAIPVINETDKPESTPEQ